MQDLVVVSRCRPIIYHVVDDVNDFRVNKRLTIHLISSNNKSLLEEVNDEEDEVGDGVDDDDGHNCNVLTI